MNPKFYTRPRDIEEAVRALENADAFPLNGGALALGVLDVPYTTIVDLQDIPELNNIFDNPNGVTIGSGVMLQSIVESAVVPGAFKQALTRAIPLNIRNNTSVLESLLVPKPPLEWLAMLAAYDVTITTIDYERAQHQFSMTETSLVVGDMGRSLRHGLMMSIHIPMMTSSDAVGSAYIARTPAGDPIMNVAVAVKIKTGSNTVEGAFAALCGLSEQTPVEVLSLDELYNKPLSTDAISAQATQVPHVLDPPDNYLGSAAYRKAMSETLVRRALEDAAAQFNMTTST